MSNLGKLDRLLRSTAPSDTATTGPDPVYEYARAIAATEGVVAVVSDLARGTSRIFAGRFADRLGITGYDSEDSIWESRILSLMSDSTREQKYLAELRFFHFVSRQPRKSRGDWFMAARLQMTGRDGRPVDVLHRMFYIHESGSDMIRFAVCLYGPAWGGTGVRNAAVNAVTGLCEELCAGGSQAILSRRGRQVLALVDSGMTTAGIAEMLCISPHTVSRHRQEILARLQVANSAEACRVARQLGEI